jgi:hypothetical protein
MIDWLGRRALGVIFVIAFVTAERASAQTCVEDQYGRIFCGRLVDPNRGAPRYQEPSERDYGRPPVREQEQPPERDYAPPPREYGQPPAREYGPPPSRESGPPPGRDFTPPAPPPQERQQSREPNRDNFGRPPPRDETRYQPPVRGRNGEWFCPQRNDTIQDGLCKPYIGR